MPTARPDNDILKKAATFSYIMGAWYFIAGVIAIVGVLGMLTPYLNLMNGAGTSTYSAEQISQMLNAIILPITVVLIITIPIAMMFGYFLFKVGDNQGVGSLKIAGVSMVIVSIAIVPLTLGIYTLFQEIPGLITSSTSDIYAALGEPLLLLLLGAAVDGIFGLIYLVGFIAGLSGMKRVTGIGDFGTAMWLAIVGIFIGITFPIGIILFGNGLSKLARQGGETRVGAPVVEEGARAPVRQQRPQLVYCPYCGAKVESDALFCPTCGSSLRKEA